MSEEVVTQEPSTTQAPSTEAATEPSLDQVFETYNVDTPATPQQAPQQSQPQPKAELPSIPDPALDPEGFKRYEASRAAESQVLRQSLEGVIGKLSQMERAELARKEEADIRSAVAFLKEGVPDADEEMLEVYLGFKARKEPRLLQVWQNRDKNPKALNAALKAVRNEAASKFALKTDPQLAENQRAMKTAQQAMATASKEPDMNEKLGKLQGASFDRAMDMIRNGMNPFS